MELACGSIDTLDTLLKSNNTVQTGFVSQSDSPNNVKMYRFDIGTVPRTPVKVGPLATFFPSGATLPSPLTSAMAAYVPSRVYFFGGVSGSRKVAMYSFNTATTTFVSLSSTTVMEAQWPTDITAATMYYYPNNGSTTMFAFNTTGVMQINTALTVR